MAASVLSTLDVAPGIEPSPSGDPRTDLVSWLGYQRHEFLRKVRDLTPGQLCEWAVPPVRLSVLGLTRHMRQMEHVYLGWGLGGGTRVDHYGEDDYAGGSADTVEEDLTGYLEEVARADAAVASMPRIDSVGLGHGRPLGFTLVKMIDEYALHSGQAHMIRFAALGEVRR